MLNIAAAHSHCHPAAGACARNNGVYTEPLHLYGIQRKDTQPWLLTVGDGAEPAH